VAPVFYALGESRLPVAVSIGSMVVNIAASLVLVEIMGFRGLALGTSIAALAHGGIALMMARRHLAGVDGARLLSTFARVVVAATAMAAISAATAQWTESALPGASVGAQSLRLIIAIGAGLAALAACAVLLRIPEFAAAIAAVRSWLRNTIGR
jgi:putative peptidoglycan lipid II flippase